MAIFAVEMWWTDQGCEATKKGRSGQFFEKQGCRMVEMSCEEHDRIAAGTQFVTHTVGRLLGHMDLRPTEIDTKGFESLLNLVNNTKNDSFELYYGLFMYNQVPAVASAGPLSVRWPWPLIAFGGRVANSFRLPSLGRARAPLMGG